MSMIVSFCAVLFPRDVLDEILDLIGSVSGGGGGGTYSSAEAGASGHEQCCTITYCA